MPIRSRQKNNVNRILAKLRYCDHPLMIRCEDKRHADNLRRALMHAFRRESIGNISISREDASLFLTPTTLGSIEIEELL